MNALRIGIANAASGLSNDIASDDKSRAVAAVKQKSILSDRIFRAGVKLGVKDMTFLAGERSIFSFSVSRQAGIS